MENLASTLILDNKRGIRINIPMKLNHLDIERSYRYYKDFKDEIYELCREAYFSGNYEIEITLIGHDGKNVGKSQFNIPKFENIVYCNDHTTYCKLYLEIYRFLIDFLDFKYILCVGAETIVLNKKDLSRYEGNLKEIFYLKSFCRKLVCDDEIINRIHERYPDAQVVKFHYFNHKEV